MSNRLIEECFNIEEQEERKHTKFMTINLDGIVALVVDPYMINIYDLKYAEPGKTALVRVRRPGWGTGDLDRYIFPIRRS